MENKIEYKANPEYKQSHKIAKQLQTLSDRRNAKILQFLCGYNYDNPEFFKQVQIAIKSTKD